MSLTVAQIKAEVDAVAETTGLKPSTIGREIGQGGKFYERLNDGAKMFPETMEVVWAKLQALKAERRHTDSSGKPSTPVQGDAERGAA